jgi:hypothetical protein
MSRLLRLLASTLYAAALRAERRKRPPVFTVVQLRNRSTIL